jgi:hypothetical protein
MALNRQQVEQQGIYEEKSTLPSILNDLEAIGKLADEAVARKKKRARTGGYTMLGGLIAAVLGGATGLPLLLGVGLLGLLFGFGWWVSSFFSGGKLIDHRVRLDITRERIAMIQQDANAQKPFSIRLALASNPTRVSEDAWHGRKNGKQQFLEETWLKLEGPLLDGTVIADDITDLTRKRTYSNARGKRKSKSRLTHLVDVRFYYRPERYGDARAADKALQGQVKVGPGAVLKDVRVSEKAIVLKALVSLDKEITPTVGMLSLGGYRILNLARRIATGQGGSAK